VRSSASSRPKQSPLPTRAGFVFVAENVASHDGPLSTDFVEKVACRDDVVLIHFSR
jgi:hypothetical protein